MFTWRHFLWLAISAVMIAGIILAAERKKPALKQVLTTALIVALLSEIIKMISVIDLVPSANGELFLPYLPMNHLPLHFCSIQILFILYCRFTKNMERREAVLNFMYPTCVCGAIMALAMPSIFQTTIPVEQAFTSPIAYQFFVFHSMVFALGIIIFRSRQVSFTPETMFRTMFAVIILGILSIYVNSILAVPTYVDGRLISVDFWTNFFFTIQNPLGIKLTAVWQWWLYLVIIIVLSCFAIAICYIPVLRKKKN